MIGSSLGRNLVLYRVNHSLVGTPALLEFEKLSCF